MNEIDPKVFKEIADVAAEMKVLGALLNDNRIFWRLSMLEKRDFADPINAVIYIEIYKVIANRNQANAMTVWTQIERDGLTSELLEVEGSKYLVLLQTAIGKFTWEDIFASARSILACSVRRAKYDDETWT